MNEIQTCGGGTDGRSLEVKLQEKVIREEKSFLVASLEGHKIFFTLLGIGFREECAPDWKRLSVH